MLVSDFIVDFLSKNGIEHAFGYPGGMVTYLMDSFARSEGIKAHVNYHEQGAAFAACGYASASGRTGVAYATSGPGATNLVTGIAEAYFDSVPVLFITGQVNTYESKGSMHLRQKGFQETDILSIVSPITKFSAAVNDENDILYMLEKAIYTANNGRKGPVLLDIPMNIQRQDIDHLMLRHFEVPKNNKSNVDFNEIFKLINSSKRPCVIAGAGIKQTETVSTFRKLVEILKIPVLTSMISADLLPYGNEYSFGFVGAYGDRQANFIISKSDLILTIGSRIDCRQVGSKRDNFAVNAKIVRLDTDICEFENSIHSDDMNVNFDLCSDFNDLLHFAKFYQLNDFSQWISVCKIIKEKLSDTVDKLYPEVIVRKISEYVPDNATITTDVGQNQVWISQFFKIKESQRILFSGGHGAMGFSLPAAIGASLSDTKRLTLCFCGDGGFMMNMQELQFIAREQLPIKIFVMNNHALGMIRHFQEMYFSSRFVQTTAQNGYTVPNLNKLSSAFGLNYRAITNVSDVSENLFSEACPELIEVFLPETTYVFPKLAINKPIQDQEPPIDRKLYKELDQL